ncbi:Importin subunit beta-1 [Mycena venus]|uniref:Importin subunit beta-1 n=1 Tax=Mycena venus TaxID=2733690 RepID=A0A8H7CY10_9AGAR|nr:Importin subunit beta-1 [Mycena venus]
MLIFPLFKKPKIFTLRANEILTAVIHDARKEEPSQVVQLSVIHTLHNSLEFLHDNFECEGEQNYIMQVVCEAAQNPSVAVQAGAFELLVRIMDLYYEKWAFIWSKRYLGRFPIPFSLCLSQRLISVQLTVTVCEEEVDLAVETQEAQEYGETPETESKDFAKIALPEIVPVLLLSTKQEELAEEDDWNVSMAAGTGFSLLAGAVQDAIVLVMIPFINAHIKSTDWHYRKAAVMTFGSILEGPGPTRSSSHSGMPARHLMCFQGDALTSHLAFTACSGVRIFVQLQDAFIAAQPSCASPQPSFKRFSSACSASFQASLSNHSAFSAAVSTWKYKVILGLAPLA